MLIKGLKIFGWSIYLLYLVVANLILNTSVLEKILENNYQETYVELENGLTLLPGIVYVHNLRVHILDQNVDFNILTHNGLVLINIPSMIKRRLEVMYWVWGVDGVLVSNQNPPPLTKSLPPDSWVIDVKKIRLMSINKLSIFGTDFLGRDSYIDGQFILRPGQYAEIGPVIFKVQNAQIPNLTSKLDGEIDLKVNRFIAYKTQGAEAYRYFNGAIRFEANLDQAKILSANIEVLKPGKMFLNILFKEGRLINPTCLKIKDWQLKLEQENFAYLFSPDLSLRLDSKNALIAKIDGPIKVFHQQKKFINVPNFSATFFTPDTDMLKPFINKQFFVNIPQIYMANLVILNQVLGWPFKQLKGQAIAGLQWSGSEGKLRARPGSRVWLQSQIRSVKGKNLSAKLNLNLRSSLKPIDLAKVNFFMPNLKINLDHVDLAYREKVERMKDWKAEFILKNTSFNPNKSTASGSLLASFTNTEPFVEYLKQNEDLSGLLTSAMQSETLELRADLKYSTKITALEQVNLSLGAGRSADGRLTFKPGQGVDGKFLIKVLFLRLGLEIKNGTMETSWFPSQFLD